MVSAVQEKHFQITFSNQGLDSEKKELQQVFHPGNNPLL